MVACGANDHVTPTAMRGVCVPVPHALSPSATVSLPVRVCLDPCRTGADVDTVLAAGRRCSSVWRVSGVCVRAPVGHRRCVKPWCV